MGKEDLSSVFFFFLLPICKTGNSHFHPRIISRHKEIYHQTSNHMQTTQLAKIDGEGDDWKERFF